jgi:hypothetical protein
MGWLKDLLGDDSDEQPETAEPIKDVELTADGSVIKRWTRRGGKLEEVKPDKDDDE